MCAKITFLVIHYTPCCRRAEHLEPAFLLHFPIVRLIQSSPRFKLLRDIISTWTPSKCFNYTDLNGYYNWNKPPYILHTLFLQQKVVTASTHWHTALWFLSYICEHVFSFSRITRTNNKLNTKVRKYICYNNATDKHVRKVLLASTKICNKYSLAYLLV